MLDKLVKMANRPDDQSRSSMAFQLAELFVNTPNQISAEAKDNFSFIINHVVLSQSDKVAERLSQALCNTDQINIETACLFAKSDQMDIANPMLQHSPAIDDETLVQIVKEKSEAHRMQIAKRENLSQHVSNAISDISNMPTLEILANNQSADFSGHSVGQILTRTPRGSEASRCIVTRLTNDTNLAMRIQRELSTELRRRLAHEGFDAEMINFQEETNIAQEEVERHIREERLQTVDAMVAKARIESHQASTEHEIQSALQGDNLLTAIRILSFHLNIPYEKAANALSGEDPSPLSVMCRAAQISEKTHAHFERLRCAYFQLDDEKAAEIAMIAQNMEQDVAVEMVQSIASRIQAAN